MNRSIRVASVRVALADGTQLGIMDTKEAIAKAEEMGLDLVEVNATVRPPVCKIIDYGKYKYEEKKRANEAATKATELKKEAEEAEVEDKKKEKEAAKIAAQG